MKTVALLVCLFGLVASQGCSNSGQAATINSTADYQRYLPCTSLIGLVIGGGANTDLSGGISLPNLQTITRTGTGFGIIIQGSPITSLSLPGLTNIDGDQFRIIDNPNLLNVTAPQAIAVSANSVLGLVIQNNPVLNLVTLGLNTLNAGELTVGGGAVQAVDGLVGTLTLGNLVRTGDIRISNNGINRNSNGAQIAVNLPALTSCNVFLLVNNSIASFTAPSALTTTDNFAVTGNTLAGFSVNLASAPTILFSNNIRTGTITYSVIFDQLTNIASGISFISNAGLAALSLANLQYADGGIEIRANPQLSSYNQPRGLIINANGYTFQGNGAATAGCRTILGVQNVTNTVTIESNTFSDLIMTQITNLQSALSISSNVINGAIIANSTFTVASTVSITGNTGTSTGYDLRGLAAAVGGITISNNQGAANAAINLGQLYIAAGGITISNMRGFTTLTMPRLGFVGTLSGSSVNSITYTAGTTVPPGGLVAFQVTGNPQLTTITTGAANSGWSAQYVLIDGNPALTTVTLGGLAQAAFVTFSNNAALTTITANQLTCAGAVNIASAGLTSAQFTGLARSTQYQISNSASSCSAAIGTSTGDCVSQCFACTNAGMSPCNGGNEASLRTLECGDQANVFGSAQCSAVTFAPIAYTGATLTPNTVPINIPGASTTTSNNNGTPNRSTTTNNNGTPSNVNGGTGTATSAARTTAGGNSSSSSVVTASAVMVFALLALLF